MSRSLICGIASLICWGCADGGGTLMGDVDLGARADLGRRIDMAGLDMAGSDMARVDMGAGSDMARVDMGAGSDMARVDMGRPDLGRPDMGASIDAGTDMASSSLRDLTVRNRILPSSVAGGRVSGIDISCGTGRTCIADLPGDRTYRLTATPDPGSIVCTWLGGTSCRDGDLTCDVFLDRDKTVTVWFTLSTDPAGCP